MSAVMHAKKQLGSFFADCPGDCHWDDGFGQASEQITAAR
jgi:hypothetical protein